MTLEGLPATAARLSEVGRRFYARGWVLGTSGNFSAVTSLQPLRIAITASAVNKGDLQVGDILQCDEHGAAVADGAASNGDPLARPSAETRLHLEIVRHRSARAVLHTHSIWTTVLSDLHAATGGFSIDGYEMLKGLHGVSSHEHREWIPIVDNDQDMVRLARRVADLLEQQPCAHAFLLRRHGLYTWGDSVAEAERHVEILEFLFEAVGRTAQFVNPSSLNISPPERGGEAKKGDGEANER
jgi:methylthioribulose-1-phosphate dehydratase